MASNIYQHVPLSGPKSIRVIVLEPAVDQAAPVRCGLYETSLDDPILFEALSYAWEGQSLEHPIECCTLSDPDDYGTGPYSTLRITKNCLDAMRAFRHESTTRMLWIDAICIDQTNNREKGVQVALMGDLYGKTAIGILVWLGKQDPAMDAAFEWVLDIGKPMERAHRSFVADKTDDIHVFEDEDMVAGILSSYERLKELRSTIKDVAKEDHLKPMFERSWFSRIWTVQEVVLPVSSIVTFHCGSLSLWFPTLLFVIEAALRAHFAETSIQSKMSLQMLLSREVDQLRSSAPNAESGHDDSVQAPAADGPRSDMTMRNVFYENFSRKVENLSSGEAGHTTKVKYYPGMDLRGTIDHYVDEFWANHKHPSAIAVSSILESSRYKDATDPRDKLFALYGILQELKVQTPVPDYDKDIDEVLFDAAVTAVESDQSLALLYQACSDTRTPDLPSWVPDLGQPGLTVLDPREYTRLAARSKAGVAFPPSWEFITEARRLKVQGKIVGSVTSTLDPLVPKAYVYSTEYYSVTERVLDGEAYRIDLHQSYEVLRTWTSTCRAHMKGSSSEDEIRTALMRTILADDPECMRFAQGDGDFPLWFSIMSLENDIELTRYAVAKRNKERKEEQEKAQNEEQQEQTSSSKHPSKLVRVWLGPILSFPTVFFSSHPFMIIFLCLLTLMYQQRSFLSKTRKTVSSWMDVAEDTFGSSDREIKQIIKDAKIYNISSSAIKPVLHLTLLVQTVARSKLFYLSDDGKIGMAPSLMSSSVQVNDKIAVIAGLSLPVVLRPQPDGRFSYVSHCYHYGVMDGEALQSNGEGLEDIVLE
ncbi:heterokaryon incompatibility protein-domain-containing protein [Xylariales sp. PMI_506]|nr:heterokaryon incompatibility protein-domain-containing protein [Xylariales sp. PMI_506]